MDRAEEARAVMIELFPGGFEERDLGGTVELVAYTDQVGEERLRSTFGSVHADEVELGWEERWREFHHGVQVGKLWVGPPWEEPPAGIEAIVIDPGQAFGTGAHPTTRLCLALLAELPRTSLLDVGCGSGVLAVAAAKLGYTPVNAVDSDPLAVSATVANARANRVEIEVLEADALAAALPEADVVVANLTLEGIRELASRIQPASLVSSGYLVDDRIQLAGFERMGRQTLDGWAAEVWRPFPE